VQVAFYGGSFNPPHVAHVLATVYALSVGFDRVLVVPVFEHAFDKPLTPFNQRVRLCELATAWLPGVEVSRIEESLPVPSLTLRSVRAIAAEHPAWQLRLLVGADAVVDSVKWHRFDEIARVAPPFVLGRVGVVQPGAPPPVLPGISSTRVRALLARRDVDAGALAELELSVPESVLEFIEAHGLYR
jgi:nicotinate-nucleotide adenylyltransferase